VLARHGETEFNVEGRWQGRSDSALTARGIAQARQLAQALAHEPITAVYSSDLGRAIATGEEVARLHGLAVTSDARLSEIDVGDWTGQLGTDIRTRDPDILATWLERPADARIPGGETLAQTQARVLSFLADRMPAHAGQTVVLITHGTVGQCILIKGLGRPLDELWLEQRLDNCSISRMEWTPTDGLSVVDITDVRHLAEVGTLRGWRVVDPPTTDSEDAA
jgi:broad specificity phosphatase PhoE